MCYLSVGVRLQKKTTNFVVQPYNIYNKLLPLLRRVSKEPSVMPVLMDFQDLR